MGTANFMIIEPTERYVAICGQVIDSWTKRPMPDVAVMISSMPIAFQNWLSRRALGYGAKWAAMAERPDRTMTSADGSFRFLDLPDGDYVLSLFPSTGAKRYGTVQKNATVSHESHGRIASIMLRVELPPTGVRGRVCAKMADPNAPAVPIVMAKVRLGSGESTYTDSEGKFVLTGVFPGQEKVYFAARGYMGGCGDATLEQGTILEMGDWFLDAEDP